MRETLRVAQLHWGFPPTIGGVETHLSVLLPEFAKRGHEVFLLTGAFPGAGARSSYKGVTVWRTPLMDLNWLYQRGLERLEEPLAKEFEDFLSGAKPHVVHAHNMHYFSKPHADVLHDLCKRRGIPLVLTAHNAWDDITFIELTTQVQWSHIIAVSHFIKKELIGTGFNDQDITVVHHGIDLDAFRPGLDLKAVHKKHKALEGRKVIFHPARMGIGKGCDVSIKAMRLVKERIPDALLVLAGTKNIVDWGATQQRDIAYMVDLVRIFGLQDSCYINVYSLDEMPGLYNASDAVVYPSSAPEPFGLTMLESMATAKPIIVTDVGGMPEIIHDGINGHVVPWRDFEALASRLIELLSNPRLCRRLGLTGRQIVEARHSKEMMADNILKVYRKTLGLSEGPAEPLDRSRIHGNLVLSETSKSPARSRK